MAKRFYTRRIKKNLAYTVEELADVTGITQATVRNWIKAGMEVLDQQRPLLVIGFQAQDFLSKRATKAKRPLAPSEVYCFRCKSPRLPDGGLADYEPTSASGGRLKAFCGVCGCICNRNISAEQLAKLTEILDIVTRVSE